MMSVDFRFKLHETLDGPLLARIRSKANGGGLNAAARFLFRYWYENECIGFSAPIRPNNDTPVSPSRQDNADDRTDLEDALASIADDWG